MLKVPILNSSLLSAIAGLGHMDRLAIADAGCPRPSHATCVDLAIMQDVPTIEMMLDLITSQMIYEKAQVAQGQQTYNPALYRKIRERIKRCELELVETDLLMELIQKECKVIVRTGAYEPWGNIILTCGVDAPKWFSKPEVVAPDFYKKRIAYTGD